jgi:alpha-1,2-glucosyltransferase
VPSHPSSDGPGRIALPAALTALGIAIGAALVTMMYGPVSDERYYAAQVRRFVSGSFEFEPGITMLPGYHALLALLLAPFGEYTDLCARWTNLAVALALLPLAWMLARRNWPADAGVKAAQSFLQPLFFPYVFLVYTEAWSAAVLLAMLLATFSGRHVVAALVGLVGTVMRQDFVFWVAFAAALAALEGLDPGRWRENFRGIARNALRTGIPYAIVMAAFMAFVVWNEGVAMSDKHAHPRPFNLANLYFFYLCAWLVFLPHCVEALPRIARLLKRPGVAALVVAAFAAYWTTWSNPHIYNQEALRWWLHNEALYWIDRRAWVRALAFVPMAWAAFTLLTTPLAEGRFRLLHVVAPVFALLHPLVEQRYYLPAMMLYIVWRAPIGRRWELGTLLLYLPAGIFLLAGIVFGAFFP